jgi:hypothetical protein
VVKRSHLHRGKLDAFVRPETGVGSFKPNPERPLRMAVDFPQLVVPMTATTMGLPERREDCY